MERHKYVSAPHCRDCLLEYNRKYGADNREALNQKRRVRRRASDAKKSKETLVKERHEAYLKVKHTQAKSQKELRKLRDKVTAPHSCLYTTCCSVSRAKYAALYASKHRDKLKENVRRWCQRNPDKALEMHRRWRYVTKYGKELGPSVMQLDKIIRKMIHKLKKETGK